MGVFRLVVLCSALFWGLAWQTASAQKLKKVSPTKYETRAPASNFSFDLSRPLNGWSGMEYPDGLYRVIYRSDDRTDYLQGVLDTRGRKPKWLLQPHYEFIEVFNRQSLAAKRSSGENYCILNLEGGACQETDFPYLTNLTYRKFQTVPDWLAPRALFIKGEQQHTMDLQLFSRDDRPLAIVRGVMRGLMSEVPGASEYMPKAYQIGDQISLRTLSPQGEVRDTLLTLNADGQVSMSQVPAHGIIEYGYLEYPKANGIRDFTPEQLQQRGLHVMTMANVELGLMWPRYEIEGGTRPMPEGLLGLKPIVFEYDGGEYFARYYGDREFAPHICCTRPLGWAAAWDTEEGALFALLPQGAVPDYATVAGSRSAASYTDIEQLWSPGPDISFNRANARRDGNLLGLYAFHGRNGVSEVYSGDEDGLLTGVTMKLEASMPSSSFPSWYTAQMQQVASQQAAYDAQLKADREMREAAQRAREQALAAQRAEAQRQAAAAAQTEFVASATPSPAPAPGPVIEKVYGAMTRARIGYCHLNTRQTDLYAEASAIQACRDRGGSPEYTYIVQSGYDAYSANADQCYMARAVTECAFD